MTRASCLHVGQHRGNAIEDTADIDVDHPVPLVDLKRSHRRQRHNASIVHENIHAAELGFAEIHECLHVLAARYIKSAESSLTFLRLNGRHELFEPLAAARPDDNVCAAFGKQPCCGFADAT